jgi:hypothetical protein
MESQPEKNATFQAIQNFNNSQSPDFKSIYSNNASVVASFFDLVLTFGEVLGLDGNTLNVEQRVRVVMAISHAKLLALLLRQQIASYEARFGEITLPTEVFPPQLASFMPEIAKAEEGKKGNEG